MAVYIGERRFARRSPDQSKHQHEGDLRQKDTLIHTKNKWDTGVPGEFRLEHLQPVETILFWNFYTFSTFILGAHSYYPSGLIMGDYCTPPRGTMEIMPPEGPIMRPEDCIMLPEGCRRPEVEASRGQHNAIRGAHNGSWGRHNFQCPEGRGAVITL